MREQYREMRDEFMAGLEDRRFLSLPDAQAKGLQVRPCRITCFRRHRAHPVLSSHLRMRVSSRTLH